MNITVFVVRVWGGQYREELIVNVTVFVVRDWGRKYREELIVNVTVFVVMVSHFASGISKGHKCLSRPYLLEI